MSSLCDKPFSQSSGVATHMTTCSAMKDMINVGSDSLVGDDLVEDYRRFPSASNEVSSISGTAYRGVSATQSTWNVRKCPDLHSADDPIVINIKTEEDI